MQTAAATLTAGVAEAALRKTIAGRITAATADVRKTVAGGAAAVMYAIAGG